MPKTVTEQIKKKNGGAGGRPRMFSDEKIEELGQQMLDIIDQEDCWHLCYYFVKAGVSKDWFYDTSKNYPKFSHYADMARYKLAAKYSNQAMANGKGDKWMIKTYINRWTGDRPEYLKELQEEEEIRARAKAQAEMDKLEEANKRARDLIEKLDANCNVAEPDERA